MAHSGNCAGGRRACALAFVTALVVAVLAAPAGAATITVNSTADAFAADSSCTLREAITAANTDAATGGCSAGSGADTITFSVNGTFTRTLAGTGDDDNASGDFDLNTPITIQGNGRANTIVDANSKDRAFDTPKAGEFAHINLKDLSIKNGDSGSVGGGAVRVKNLVFVTLENVEVSGNKTTGDGGAVFSNGYLTVKKSYLHDNSAGSSGGAIAAEQQDDYIQMTVEDTTFERNTALRGGGVFVQNNVSTVDTIRRSTFTSNTATGTGGIAGGGGVATAVDGSLYILTSTFYSNTASKDGGAIQQADGPVRGGTTYVQFSTLLGNTADQGDGGNIRDQGGYVWLYGSVVARGIDNSPVSNNPDVSGSFFGGGANFVGSTTGATGINGPFRGSNTMPLNPDLATTPALNGGSDTLNFLPTSNQLLDQGASGCEATDQRGTTRPLNSWCDIGSVEAPIVFTDHEPPDTTITSGPHDFKDDTIVLFLWTGTDNDRVATFQCKYSLFPGDDWFGCGNGYFQSGVIGGRPYTEGNHTLTVRAVDASENVDPTPATWSFTVDRTPPETTFYDRPPAFSSSKSATISWTTIDAISGVTLIECALDGEPFTPCSGPRNFSNLSQGSHTFQVRGTDRLGNTETAKSVTWFVDTIPPHTMLTKTPASESTAADAAFEFITADVGGSGVDRAECALDTDTYTTCTSAKTYPNIADGSHLFKVRAVDKAGNTDDSPAAFSWFNDSHAPTLTFGTTPPAVATSPNWSVSFTTDDGAGIGGVTTSCALDGSPLPSCSSPVSGTTFEGGHSLVVTARDAYGNSTSKAVNWTVDTTPPDTTISEKPSDPSTAADATFKFSATDSSGVARTECSYDSAPYATCTSPKTYPDVDDGSHTFRVRGVDNVGNVETTPAVHTWFNDSHAPALIVSSKPEGTLTSSAYSFLFSTNDGTGIGGVTVTCSLDGSASLCMSPFSGTVDDGSHTVTLTARDVYNNATTQTFTWFTDANAPDTTITAKPSDPSNAASPQFRFAANDGGGTGVARTECSLDGEDYATCSSPQTYPNLADGSHTLLVRGVDNIGNVETSPAAYTWTIDTVAPTTTLGSTAPNPSTVAGGAITFTAADSTGGTGLSRTECKLGSGSWDTCTSPFTFTLADGTYTLQIRSVDKAGNVESPVSYTWVIDANAPDTIIDNSPADPSGSPDPSFSFTGADPTGGTGVARLECKLDDDAYEDCTSPMSYAGLDDGSHTFLVRAYDGTANVDPTPASYTWTVDTEAPVTTIGAKPDALTSAKSSFVAFSTSDDGTGVKESQCRIGSAAFTTCTSPYSFSDLADGSYTFEVRTVDKYGRTESPPKSYTWTIDTTAPTVAIVTKPDDPALSDDATFTFSTTDANGIDGAECVIDGGTPAPCTSPADYDNLPDGNHTFAVHATDKAGNTSGDETYAWTVDANAPTTTLTAKPGALVSSGAARFEFSGDDGTGSGVAEFRCTIDTGAASVCTNPVDLSGLSDGSHTFTVAARDGVGHDDASPETWTWVVDTTAPTVGITSKPSDPALSADGTFEWSATDANGVDQAECSIDGGTFTKCTSPQPYLGLPDGSHTFRVHATDDAGNTSGDETYTWDVDANDPTTTLAVKPAAVVASTGARFEFSGADGTGGSGVAQFRCTIDGGAATVCTSPLDLTGVGDGEHTFTVAARDAAGRDDGSPATWTWNVDTTAPATTIASGPNATSTSTSASFTFSGDDGPGSGIDRFECKVDDGVFAACKSPLALSGLALGDHTLAVRAIDKLGHTDATPANYAWKIEAPPVPPSSGGNSSGGGGGGGGGLTPGTPNAPGGSGETPVPPPVATRVGISHLQLRLRSNRIQVTVRCTAAAGSRCRGTLTLRPTSKRTRRDRLALARAGTVKIDVPAGKKKVIKIEPTAKLLALLEARGKVVAQVRIKLDGAAAQTFERMITVLSTR